jgi:hypothetical protein
MWASLSHFEDRRSKSSAWSSSRIYLPARRTLQILGIRPSRSTAGTIAIEPAGPSRSKTGPPSPIVSGTASPDAVRQRIVAMAVGAHGGAQLPDDDVAREVLEDGRQIEPTPADDLEVSEVGLPELVRRCCLLLELVGRLDDDEGRPGDQIVSLEQPINRRFRDKITSVSVKRVASSRGDRSGTSNDGHRKRWARCSGVFGHGTLALARIIVAQAAPVFWYLGSLTWPPPELAQICRASAPPNRGWPSMPISVRRVPRDHSHRKTGWGTGAGEGNTGKPRIRRITLLIRRISNLMSQATLHLPTAASLGDLHCETRKSSHQPRLAAPRWRL